MQTADEVEPACFLPIILPLSEFHTLQLQVRQTGVERVDVITGVSLIHEVLHAPQANSVLSLQVVRRWHLTSHG